MLRKKRKRPDAEIPTSSMADVSFLLLLFFLVTTTIDVDTGIGLVLPPHIEDTKTVQVKQENILKVLVNTAGEVLIDDEFTSIPQIHTIVLNRIRANDKLIISIKTDRQTPYNQYIQTMDEIKVAYTNLREEFALETYNRPMRQLTKDQLDFVREKVPQRISIAEPETTTR